METSNVNQVAFTARMTKTKQGNDYKKTNIGLNSGLLLPSVGLLGYDLVNQKGFKNFGEAFKTRYKSLKFFDLKMNLITTVVGLAVGLLVDNSINKSRAKKADETAQSKVDVKA